MYPIYNRNQIYKNNIPRNTIFLGILSNTSIEKVTYGNGVTLICKLLWSKWSELDFIILLIILTEITMIIVNI